MRKELIISTIPQETRIAVLEDDELVELLIERHRSQGIVGNIYKGRVTKVLPGMQSAFVDIGLDRDAFLYVSDFFEDTDEYERIVSSAEDEALDKNKGERPGRQGQPRTRRPIKRTQKTEETVPANPEAETARRASEEKGGRRTERRDRTPRVPAAESRTEVPASPIPPEESGVSSKTSDRKDGRRTERRDRKPRIPSFESRSEGPGHKGLEVLPGESLAKYKGVSPTPSSESDPESEIEQIIDETEEQHILEKYPIEARMAIVDQDAPLDENEVRSTREPPNSDRLESGGSNGPEVSNLDKGEGGDDEPGVPGEPGGLASPVEEGDPGPTEPEEHPSPVSSDLAAPDEGEGSGPNDEPGSGGPFRRVRIWGRRDNKKFSRKPPARRTRRRPPSRQEATRSAETAKEPMISELLKEGQEILVQVSKEPLGKKGARITSHIALPGRYLVYMPTVDHIGVSRRIASDDERARLRGIISENRDGLGGGFIVRTAAAGKDEKEFVQDLRFLSDLWADIRQRSEKSRAPSVIHSDLNLVQRVLRDQLSNEFTAIRLDSEVEYEKVLEFVSRCQPALVNRVRLHLKDNPIFEEYGLQQEVDKAMRSKVWLRSGGYIVVNQTEALVAIDVNTGKFVGKSNRLEDTIVRTNMDAVHEIVRQVRLRNLGGIIVVDFIDMEERKSRHKVMQALEEELQKDRSPSKILQFNDFGLVAITRKRTQPSLERVLGATCPRCAGAGFVKAVETVCYEIQEEVRKMLAQMEGRELTVRVSPEVAKAIKSGDLVDLTELEDETNKHIRVQADPSLDAERFDVF